MAIAVFERDAVLPGASRNEKIAAGNGESGCAGAPGKFPRFFPNGVCRGEKNDVGLEGLHVLSLR